MYIEELKRLIISNAGHPYLLHFLDKPVIDDNKLFLLVSMLEDLDLTDEEMDKYIISTMLVQIALDTHELVTNSTLINENMPTLRNRQLTVLAGDYYSGLYYKILSDINQVPLIQALAAAIKDINEEKIKVYQSTIDDINVLLESIRIIEASLVLTIAEFFKKTAWSEYVSNLLLLKRLIDEKQAFENNNASAIVDVLKKILFPKIGMHLTDDQRIFIVRKLDQCIIHVNNLTEQARKTLTPINEQVKIKLDAIGKHNLVIANSFVEEG
jgi:heptaprenyl diphosphate synthase